MASNEIIYQEKTITAIESANVNLEDSLSLDELPIDTLTAVVRDESLENDLLSSEEELAAISGLPIFTRLSTDGLKDYSYGEIVRYYHGEDLIGKFYLESIKRLGRSRWQFNCISAIGLLMTSYHYGGIYTGETAEEVIADVVSDIIPYTLDDSLKETKLYGWLPKGTRRDNLRDILFAIGARIQKDESGDVVIVPYSDTDAYPILQSGMYLDNGSVTSENPATQIKVTEYAYLSLEADEVTTLYDGAAYGEPITTPNGQEVNGIIVEFRDPMHDLEASGCNILESGANYAVLSGSSYAKLSGKKYSHTERIVSRGTPVSDYPNVVVSDSCHLVNLSNSEVVADRLMAFYGAAKRVGADIVVTNQKPGDYVSFTDPFGDRTLAYIESLDITMSNVLKGAASFVAGYIPPGSGNLYTREVILTGSGTWTVPDGVTSIRYALFAGAQGGHAGNKGGTSGGSRTVSYQVKSSLPGASGKITATGAVTFWAGPGGDGGEGGPGGSGSKIYEGRMEVTPGTPLPYKCGTGGTGAIYSGSDTPGNDGTETTLAGNSSNNGSIPSVNGWVDILTGEVYATSGQSGLPGGKGAGYVEGLNFGSNESSLDVLLQFTEATPAIDEDGVSWSGGKTQLKSGFSNVAWWSTYQTGDYGGAHGASAGYGMAPGGAAGTPAASEINERGTYSYTWANAHDGVKGRTPTLIPKKPGLTIGGRGGYGGGGGSVAGWAGWEKRTEYSGSLSSTAGKPGEGGEGGQGGPGGDGMIIIYY